LRVDALASGSSGNAYLLRTAAGALLLEAGLPAPQLVRYLWSLDFDPRELSGILLTHAHSDHRQGARGLSDRFGVPIYATVGTLGHPSLHDSALARPVEPGRTLTIGELEVLAFSVPHDCSEPVGFRVRAGQASLGLVTDLGFVPDHVPRLLRGVDLLVLEANHDEELLQSGPYPTFLKRRVASRHGHLSNRAAAECLAAMSAEPPGQVWLAHLSQTNNSPATALRAVGAALREIGLDQLPLAAAGRKRPSLSWTTEPGPRQLPLL
jgi:phosphoribosyl 1,2-cyclic phosphodiesterase